jgi:hypothetical protein
MLLLIAPDAKPQPRPAEPRWSTVTAGAWTARRGAPHALPLDYCDLAAGGETIRNINTWEANWIVWQRHGFERPAWDNAVQYRTRIFDRNRFAEGSGFTATFRFEVADAAALQGLVLAAENPELYQFEVNGKPLQFASGAVFGERHLRSAPLAGAARVGENTVTMTARPFDVRMELENILLLGDFTTQPSERGFRIGAAPSLRVGSWKSQGLHFYSGEVTYTARITVPAGATRIRVDAGEWAGSVLRVEVGGAKAERLWQPWSVELPVKPGPQRIALTVAGTPRNLLGPFHNPSKPRMRAWPAAWAEFPKNQPPGADYDLLDYGMMTPPVIRVDVQP